MSIFFDFEVPSTGRRFRRAVDDDKVDIQQFWKPKETETLFRAQSIGTLIELSTLSICMINEDMDVTGFLALSDYPPIPGVDPAAWEVWMRNMFQKYYVSRNTLFIHFMCNKDAVSEYFLEEALISVFMNDFYLQHIILIVPPTCEIDCMAKYPTFRRRSVYKHCVRVNEDFENCIVMFVARRQDFCPKLKVRKAVEEDNDEIVQILDSTSEKLRDMYGEFYISEIISRHPESKRTIIVAETPLRTHDKVVGVMGLNLDVNYANLQNTYELGPFYGLVQAPYIDRDQRRRANSLLKSFGDPIMSGNWGPFDKIQAEKLSRNSKTDDTIVASEKPRTSKIQFKKQSARRRSESESIESVKCMTSPILPESSLMYLMDDEPLEYEIINIDTNQLFSSFEVPATEMFPRSRLKMENAQTGAILHKKKSWQRINFYKSELLFKGKPNAFCIELFGFRWDTDERYAFDLLESAFECMANYEYCIIRVPTTHKSFPLLHHFCYVPTKPKICSDYALYIAHRNSVLGKFRIREAEFADIPQITTLFNKVEGKQAIWTVANSIMCTRKHLAYVFLCGTAIIGIGILDPPEHVDLLRTKFLLENYQREKYHRAQYGGDGGMASLKTVLVYHAFEPHFAFFAREMMRFSGSSTLIWLTAYRNKWVANKANGIVSVMTPLPYRATGTSGLTPDLQELHSLSKHLISFSAWFTSKKMTSIPRSNVDTRIVVVGASTTAIAFLYSLLFHFCIILFNANEVVGDGYLFVIGFTRDYCRFRSPLRESCSYLTFTNVTLVSPHGLPYLRHNTPAAEMMFSKRDSTSDQFLKSTPFTYYVNVVHGTMVAIDRQDKYIVIENESRVHYDLLFLLIGQQYHHPDYMKSLHEMRSSKTPEYVRMDHPNHRFTQLEPPVEFDSPENVFFVNTLADANSALNNIKSYFWQCDDFKVCVYGACFNAYCCVTALLHMNVFPEDIIFVEPFPPENQRKPRVTGFCNSRVDETVRQIMESLNITTYRGYYFDSWLVDETGLVTTVNFTSVHHFLRVNCCGFFYYGKKNVNPHAFVAINRCGIAYDGGILIDHKFQTNDPSVFAAGPATRYFRRYMAHRNIQKLYDSKEIGKILGEQIRNTLDPLFSEPKKRDVLVRACRSGIFANPSLNIIRELHYSEQSAWEPANYKLRVPKFKKPKVWYGILPGNLQYLEVRPPGRHIPHYYMTSLDYNGYIIETFTSGYFKLHLSSRHIVDGITCLTPATQSIQNFKRLFGLSAVVLNNVHLRYSAGKIKDLFEFFQAPWSGFLYNDKAKELLTIVKYLKPKNNPFGETMEEVLRKVNNEMTSIEAKLRVRSNFEKAQYFDVFADYIIKWISDNEILFPMYITPNIIAEYAADVVSQPLFKRRKSTMNKMLAMILE